MCYLQNNVKSFLGAHKWKSSEKIFAIMEVRYAYIIQKTKNKNKNNETANRTASAAAAKQYGDT